MSLLESVEISEVSALLYVCFPAGLDSWLNLTRVDPDEEVQGEIHLALELHRDAQRTSLHCHVIEAR